MRSAVIHRVAFCAVRLLVVAVFAALPAGCGDRPEPQRATAVPSPSKSSVVPSSPLVAGSPTVGVASSAQSPTDLLTGFGALDAIWQSRHTEDGGRYAPGMSYDNNRFGAVLHLDGRVMGFDINFGRGTSFEVARAAVLEQLPPDTTVAWSKDLAECRVFQLQSPTLGKVLYPKWSPWKDYVQVEYTTGGIDVSFNPRDVRVATLILGSGTPDETTVC